MAQRDALSGAEIFHEAVESGALHAGHAVGAGLFFVGQNADAGAFRILHVKQSLQLGVGADTVVLTVTADQGTVQTDLADVISGNGRELGREEILLRNAVHVVEDAHDGQLDAILAFVGIGR